MTFSQFTEKSGETVPNLMADPTQFVGSAKNLFEDPVHEEETNERKKT